MKRGRTFFVNIQINFARLRSQKIYTKYMYLYHIMYESNRTFNVEEIQRITWLFTRHSYVQHSAPSTHFFNLCFLYFLFVFSVCVFKLQPPPPHITSHCQKDTRVSFVLTQFSLAHTRSLLPSLRMTLSSSTRFSLTSQCIVLLLSTVLCVYGNAAHTVACLLSQPTPLQRFKAFLN